VVLTVCSSPPHDGGPMGREEKPVEPLSVLFMRLREVKDRGEMSA